MGLGPIFCFKQMYRQNTDLLEMIEPVVNALGYDLLGIEQLGRGRKTLLRLYIDNINGISLDDCERVSVQVTGILDINDPIRGAYDLEISSPGFDRPLFTLEHFRRFIGHTAQIQLHQKMAGRRKFVGEITAVNTDNVEITMDGLVYQVDADNIERARLVPD